MENYSKILNGWFSEICPMWEGVALSIQVDKTLYSNKSKYQQIDLYQTRTHGKMLVLDDIIQLTERDEFGYQEMMTHVALFAHPDPKKVLVIGGGDGGVLREVAKHPGIETIDSCEIDAEVIDVCKKYLPSLSCGYDDPRVNVHIEDANEFVKRKENGYDVIIVDSSDPIGPGEALFEKPFYESLKKALKEGGIVATQGESFYLHQDTVENLTRIVREVFPIRGFANILVPSYPGGHIGVCLGSLGPELVKPARPVPDEIQKQLKYYSPKVHEASFVLPYFSNKMMEGFNVPE